VFILSKYCDGQAGENKSVIFASKITMPLRRQQLLERSHLVERLHGGLDGKLTLISAPGGFGKTSLACQWLEASRIPVAWYSIDESDAEQGLFFKYLVASLADTGDQLREALPENSYRPLSRG